MINLSVDIVNSETGFGVRLIHTPNAHVESAANPSGLGIAVLTTALLVDQDGSEENIRAFAAGINSDPALAGPGNHITVEVLTPAAVAAAA